MTDHTHCGDQSIHLEPDDYIASRNAHSLGGDGARNLEELLSVAEIRLFIGVVFQKEGSQVSHWHSRQRREGLWTAQIVHQTGLLFHVPIEHYVSVPNENMIDFARSIYLLLLVWELVPSDSTVTIDAIAGNIGRL